MPGPRPQAVTRRRVLLLGAAALLTVSGLLAVAILLFGSLGAVQGRILGTTAILGGFGILALPAAMLLDQDRARRLAWALAAICVAAAGLSVALVWWGGAPDVLGRSALTATAIAVALAQTAALVGRRRPPDPPVVRALFAAAALLATAATALFLYLVWSDADSVRLGRILGAVAVLDLLAVALQPILARAQGEGVRVRIRITDDSGASREAPAEGRDLAAAVAGAIRGAEAEGVHVTMIEVLHRPEGPSPA